MESQGKMLVALSLIVVLMGFSAIGYIAVQRNANVASRAVDLPSTSATISGGVTPSGGTGGSPTGVPTGSITDNGGLGGTPAGSSFRALGSCTIDQDCIDQAMATRACKPTAPCPPSGGTYICSNSTCTISGGTGGGSTPLTCSTKTQGDFDCNGKVDCQDLTFFVAELSETVPKVSLADFEMGRAASNGVWTSCQL